MLVLEWKTATTLSFSFFVIDGNCYIHQKFPLESEDSILTSTLKQFSSYLDDVSTLHDNSFITHTFPATWVVLVQLQDNLIILITHSCPACYIQQVLLCLVNSCLKACFITVHGWICSHNYIFCTPEVRPVV